MKVACISILFILGVLASGCSSQRVSSAGLERPLPEVVDALQYAIEDVDRANLWAGTAVEQKHWLNACSAARETASKDCTQMLLVAGSICQRSCRGRTCNYADNEICRRFSVGEDRVALCGSTFRNTEWCNAAQACNTKTNLRDSVCGAAASLTPPRLDHASVVLAVERAGKLGASINALVVVFEAGGSHTASNTISLELGPRIRSIDYGSDTLPPIPDPKTVSPEAIKLSSEIKALLTDAITAVIRDNQPASDGSTAAVTPPMNLKNFEVELALTLESSGKLGIKKTFLEPVSVGVDAGVESKKSNTIKIVFGNNKQ